MILFSATNIFNMFAIGPSQPASSSAIHLKSQLGPFSFSEEKSYFANMRPLS